MKFFAKLVTVIAFAFFSIAGHAAKTAAVEVVSVSTGGSGNVIITTTGDFVNPAGCTNSAYLLLSTNSQLKSYLAILLTASASGKPIRLTVSDTQCVNDGKNPRISNIELQ